MPDDGSLDPQKVIEWAEKHNTASLNLKISPQMAIVISRLLFKFGQELKEREEAAKILHQKLIVEHGPMKKAAKLHDVTFDRISEFSQSLGDIYERWQKDNPMPGLQEVKRSNPPAGAG